MNTIPEWVIPVTPTVARLQFQHPEWPLWLCAEKAGAL